jgi:hypothetical protein
LSASRTAERFEDNLSSCAVERPVASLRNAPSVRCG